MIHTCMGKTTISNRETVVEVTKINGRDEEGDKSTASVHFTMQTSKNENQSFSLRKMVGPTQIDGYVKGRS